MQEAQPSDVQRGTEFAGKDTRSVSLKRLTEAARRPGLRAARTNRLSYAIREGLFGQEPWLWRGTLKQTGDLVKHGFTVVKPGSKDKHDNDDLVQAWLRKTRTMSLVRDALMAAHLHGDGLVEIEWDDNQPSDQPVKPGSMPVAVHVIDPVTISFQEVVEESGVVPYLVQENLGTGSVVLHPDRYHHFFFFRFPGYRHAKSTVEVVYHAAMAKVKGDQGSGEVVYNAGQPKVHATVKDAHAGEIEETTEMVNDPDFVRGYVTDERTTFQQLNPVTLDPSHYYDGWKSSEAAGIGIPVMMLEGAQAGAVTGSETNLEDYRSDQHQARIIILEPFFTRIVSALILQSEEEFDIKWAEQPMSKTSMALAARDAGTAFTLFRNGGFTREAAARLAGLEVGEDDFEEEPEMLMPPVQEGPDGRVPGAVARPAPGQGTPGQGQQGAPPAS